MVRPRGRVLDKPSPPRPNPVSAHRVKLGNRLVTSSEYNKLVWRPTGEDRSERQRQFGMDKRDTLPRYCRECEVRFACHGGCPKDRFTHTPHGEPGHNYLCPSYKLFFHHVEQPMWEMARLRAADRGPVEIMREYAAAEPAADAVSPAPATADKGGSTATGTRDSLRFALIDR
jgi:radical SAM protein with 4Fe4S-binding SPASM domain